MGYAWYIRKRFWMVYMRELRQLIQECSIQGISLLQEIFRCKQVRRNPSQKVVVEPTTNLKPKWLKSPNIFAIFSSNFWFLKRPSTGILTLFLKECILRIEGSRSLRFQRNARRKIIGGKVSRGRTELAVHLKTISTAVLAWMVVAQLHLPMNSAKKCARMHHQTDEQSSRSEKWLKFSGNVEHAWQLVNNASGRRAADVFMETTEEHKVLRPIERAQIHNSHTVTEKGPSHGENWSYRASWRGGHVPKFAMRQQRKDVSPKYKKTQR